MQQEIVNVGQPEKGVRLIRFDGDEGVKLLEFTYTDITTIGAICFAGGMVCGMLMNYVTRWRPKRGESDLRSSDGPRLRDDADQRHRGHYRPAMH